MQTVVKKAKTLKGEITPPPDKSISHRAVMFASLAKGASNIKNFLWAKDPLSSLNAMRSLGVEIKINDSKEIIVYGRGLHSLKEPENIIDCENSGTTLRLLSGILAGQPFLSVLTGDESLRHRPMRRIIEPLRIMGADIHGRADDKFPPVVIKGGRLKGVNYRMSVASAQVKSAILLAGIYAKGETSVTEPHKSRDHTERMLKSMDVDIDVKENTVRITPPHGELSPFDITIPNDFSSSAFFIAAALMIPHSEILLRNVCLNPTRIGFLEVLKEMGAQIEIFNVTEQGGEPAGDILCKASTELKGVTVHGDIIPRMIDEFPVLCIVASQAEGKTIVKDAGELRVKESDRIMAMTSELKKMGVDIKDFEDGVEINGPCKLKPAEVYSYKDHRIAMALSIAGLLTDGETTIRDTECIDISFPQFYELLGELQR